MMGEVGIILIGIGSISDELKIYATTKVVDW